ncbi:MAG TPA: SLC13 family permease [Thermoanaerobaculia bacterium]|jgi:Na+/H+ antiporter NhaD/arsenite permease-like protein|nr:SLC13 family permease [Thermoanaerobaculia bacterium]
MTIVIIAGLLAIAFLATGRVTPQAAWHSIDVDLLLVLFALLIAVELLRESGWLDLAVEKTVARFHSARSFAAMMLAVTGILAMLVTNDIALFVAIPFTVAAGRMSGLKVDHLVVLEVIAANLLGCLTPLGNPQNLFIYHRSHWSAGRFVLTMLPFVALAAIGLAVAVALFRNVPLTNTEAELPPRNNRAAVAGTITFLLVLLEIARAVSAWPAAIAALLSALLFLRRRVDLSVVLLFFFAFIVVDGLRTFSLRLLDTYWSSIALSQVISNVPAAVLLTPFAHGEWRELLYGVNAGGCGTIIASLANLLGWQIYVREAGRDPRFFFRLTWTNVAFLAWVGIGGRLLLR